MSRKRRNFLTPSFLEDKDLAAQAEPLDWDDIRFLLRVAGQLARKPIGKVGPTVRNLSKAQHLAVVAGRIAAFLPYDPATDGEDVMRQRRWARLTERYSKVDTSAEPER